MGRYTERFYNFGDSICIVRDLISLKSSIIVIIKDLGSYFFVLSIFQIARFKLFSIDPRVGKLSKNSILVIGNQWGGVRNDFIISATRFVSSGPDFLEIVDNRDIMDLRFLIISCSRF